MSKAKHHPYHPIIYVRGFAATQSEIEDTVADPYMGFNIGSTKARTAWTGDVQRFYFESPLARLMAEHDYEDVYVEGDDLLAAGRAQHPVPYRSVVIFRYYDEASKDFGDHEGTPPIEHFAKGLDALFPADADGQRQPDRQKSPHLFSVFLDPSKSVKASKSVSFAFYLKVLVPDYEVDGLAFLKRHYEGGFLFQKLILVEAIPDKGAPSGWRIKYGYQDTNPGKPGIDASTRALNAADEGNMPGLAFDLVSAHPAGARPVVPAGGQPVTRPFVGRLSGDYFW